MNNKEKFAYSGMHPFTVAFHIMAQICLTMFILHPVFVAISLVFSLSLCIAVVGEKFLKELKFYLPFYVIVAISNPLFSHNGATPMFFLNGKPITYEALIYGIVSSGMFLSILLWCRVWSAVITDDKLLYLLSKRFPKIGLVLTVTLRMIPRFRMKWEELREVRSTVDDAVKKGFVAKVKGALRLFSALITQAMESSMETGMSMAARGYGVQKRTSIVRYKFRASDALFLALNVVLLATIVVLVALGATKYSFYPYIMPISGGDMTIAVYVLYAAQSAMLLFKEVKEEALWNFCRSKI